MVFALVAASSITIPATYPPHHPSIPPFSRRHFPLTKRGFCGLDLATQCATNSQHPSHPEQSPSAARSRREQEAAEANNLEPSKFIRRTDLACLCILRPPLRTAASALRAGTSQDQQLAHSKTGARRPRFRPAHHHLLLFSSRHPRHPLCFCHHDRHHPGTPRLSAPVHVKHSARRIILNCATRIRTASPESAETTYEACESLSHGLDEHSSTTSLRLRLPVPPGVDLFVERPLTS